MSYIISSGKTSNGIFLEHQYSMIVLDGGTANCTTIARDGGYLYVSSGGIANSTIVSGGRLSVNSGGTANSTTVNFWGGVTWTLINGYSAEWECVATGDFNGDGKCDMLWRNWFEGDGGLTYNAYCTWIVDPQAGETDWRMVSVANPGEWDFLCSGDFDGDKMNDIAMINDVGVVGIWGVSDGWLSSWSILSAVNPAEWTLAGVGDFNADGTDDIAWCNSTTGQVGAWQIENKELASWQTLVHIV